MLTELAPAKVNLVLEVLERRETYHVISSIAQTVDLCDRLTFEPDADLVLTCSEPSLVPGNLVTRAAALLRERFHVRAGARIHLEKHIPWGAGLGGGSSDAAATLRALVRLWGIGAPHGALDALGAQLGSDVPLFLHGGTVLLEGRGEKVSDLPAHPERYALLLLPASTAPDGKTGRMYGMLRPDSFTKGQFVRAAQFALSRGRRVPDELMFNAFEAVAAEAFPSHAADRALLEGAAGAPAHLAGSGPCLYALLPSKAEAEAAEARLHDVRARVRIARFTGPQAADVTTHHDAGLPGRRRPARSRNSSASASSF